ncbi:MAG: hypothetical protein ACOYYS_23175 [Chloroflexota bacterium]
MTLPSVVLGVVLSTLYGAGFHLWKGGGLSRLLLYLFLGWSGFWGGQLLAGILGWSFDRVGGLHVGAASVGSLLFLGIGYWLSLVEVARKP